MRIRCNNCYRVLNENEVYCTRCGTYSPEIKDIMNEKYVKIDEGRKFSINLSLYFSMVFLVSGVLIIAFSVLFDRFYPDVNYGDLSSGLPAPATLFANTNALFTTSVAMLFIFGLIERKEIKQMFKLRLVKIKWMIPLFLIGVALFALLTKYTNFIVIPSFYKKALVNPEYGLSYLGQWGMFKIIGSLLAFAIVQELVIRYGGGNALDDVSLIPDFFLIIVITFLASIIDWAAYAFDLHILLGNFVLQLFLSSTYIIFNRSIVFNLIFRFSLIILIIIIL